MIDSRDISERMEAYLEAHPNETWPQSTCVGYWNTFQHSLYRLGYEIKPIEYKEQEDE